MLNLDKEWTENALKSGLKYEIEVVELFNRHQNGIVNAFLTNTSSGKHENLNGRNQSVLAKARGFINFDRFKVDVMFYFGNLDGFAQKFY